MSVELVKVKYYYCVCKCGFCGLFCLPPSLPVHGPLLSALLRLHGSLRRAHLQRVSVSPARWVSKGPAVCVFCAVRFLLVYVFLLSYRHLQLSKWASVCVFLPRWGNLSEEQQVQSSADRLVQIGLCQRPTVWVWPMNVSLPWNVFESHFLFYPQQSCLLRNTRTPDHKSEIWFEHLLYQSPPPHMHSLVNFRRAVGSR